MSEPTKNPIRRRLQLLLGACGYNFYGDANKARADDLLIRQAASARLGAAAKALAQLELDYRKRFIPPSTREAPYPPADVMDSLRQITALKAKIGDVEASLRGLSAPTQDKIWWRFRNELTTLEELLSYDTLLIEQADLVQTVAESLTASAWNDGGEARDSLTTPLREIEGAMQSRQRLLQIPR